ncbi:MAG: efflux RND transporter periplasmic adaptor subunit [Thermoguttaceae bacterium]|nr:efflux RND transporter periplasmic adaptor subunit [Thermoguttaceae bacterium]
MRRIFPVFIVFCLVLCVAAGCDFLPDLNQKNAEKGSKKPPVPVKVVSPIERDVVDYAELVGRLESYQTVDLMAQVAGQIVEIPYSAGALVKKGELLIKIDPQIYDAVYRQRESEVRAKEVELNLLETDFARQRELLARNATSQSAYDRAVSDRDLCAAQLDAAKAARDSAKIDLDFTNVTAPIEGVVSHVKIDVGNVVAAKTSVLAEIHAVDPIYATFEIDERSLERYYKNFGDGKQSAYAAANVVEFTVGEEDVYHKAKLDSFEPVLDTNTGTLKFFSVVANKPDARGFRPFVGGSRIRGRLPVCPPYRAILIPEEAILTDQNVKYVYTVDASDNAVFTKIELGALQEDSMRVVKSGLTPDDRVIVDNLLRVRRDEPVEPTPVETKSSAKIVREDGTVFTLDGETYSDDIYEESRAARAEE